MLYIQEYNQEYTNIFALFYHLVEVEKFPFSRKYRVNYGLFRDGRMGGVEHPYSP